MLTISLQFLFGKISRLITVLLLLFISFHIWNCANSSEKKVIQLSSDLHYQLSGEGNQTLVFIHGWCINHSYWTAQVSHFNDRYRILNVDLPGHGNSPPLCDDFSITAYAGKISQLINDLELDSLILVGHSMSGNVMLRMYKQIPKRVIGLVGVDNLHDPGAVPGEEEMKAIDDFFSEMEKDFPVLSREYAQQSLFTEQSPAEVREQIIQTITGCDPEIAVPTLRALVREGEFEKELLAGLKVPLQLIVSDSEKAPPVETDTLAKYAGAGFGVFSIRGTGHYPMAERPDEFNRQLEAALKSITQADNIKPTLFFLHNRFLETHDLNEAHPEYGRVEYREILDAYRQEGLKVISEQRRGNVNARDYAEGIVHQIDSLISKGVRPENITVVGTSKGGYIAQYVSTLANNPQLNFVFIGSFRKNDLEEIPDINFCGNILNIYEKTDPFGVSAAERKTQSTCDIAHFREVELNTGLGHGFLFRPLPEWIQPSVAWAKGNYKSP